MGWVQDQYPQYIFWLLNQKLQIGYQNGTGPRPIPSVYVLVIRPNKLQIDYQNGMDPRPTPSVYKLVIEPNQQEVLMYNLNQ